MTNISRLDQLLSGIPNKSKKTISISQANPAEKQQSVKFSSIELKNLSPQDKIIYSDVKYKEPLVLELHNDRHSEDLSEIMDNSVKSARQEWMSGVKEKYNSNRSIFIDRYAKNASFNPGNEWCGFFVAFNYSEAGNFKYPSDLASYQKARDFFMYRKLTDHSNKTNNKMDQLRMEHEQNGSKREYFMLEGAESPNNLYVKSNKKLFNHYDAESNTFNFQQIPIKSGDTALFSRGHIGMVESYDSKNGKLSVIEGNAIGNNMYGERIHGVVKNEYDLSNPEIRKKFDGFGRPALGDFE